MKRFCRFLAEEYHLERLANLAPKHLFAYVDHLQNSNRAASTIKTDLSAIRFFHDQMPNPRHQLPQNTELQLERRRFGEIDRTWSKTEFNCMLAYAMEAGREDYITLLYLARFLALRIHECFRLDTATVRKALKEKALTVKGKGGLVRTVPIPADFILQRLQFHLEQTPAGHKLFVSDGEPTHSAIKTFQIFIYLNRSRIYPDKPTRPITFHGLRHNCAAEWYGQFRSEGANALEARRKVSKLLGHDRDEVTKIYLASFKEENSHD
jgi:Site-specific recombinase XerD